MQFQLKLIVFAVASAGLIWLSWHSLRGFHKHGFYRFFAFEAIVVLILLNLDCWFKDPFGTFQVISWVLLIISCVLAAHGFLLLKKVGKPDSEINDPSRMGIEKTTRLVTSGAYRYVRHPIYSSALVGIWGIFLKRPTWTGLCLIIFIGFFLILTAKVEESENIRVFGDAYRDYMKKTRMFFPYLS